MSKPVSPNTNIDDLDYILSCLEEENATPPRMTIKEAKTQLQALLTAAKIEELQMLPVNYNRPRTSRFIPYSVIEERIKELEKL
jgi:hypothetical protein